MRTNLKVKLKGKFRRYCFKFKISVKDREVISKYGYSHSPNDYIMVRLNKFDTIERFDITRISDQIIKLTKKLWNH